MRATDHHAGTNTRTKSIHVAFAKPSQKVDIRVLNTMANSEHEFRVQL